MSELKAYIGPAPDEKGLADYYLKSEADKVIARHKYKRCLAMAGKCRLHARWFGDNAFYKKEQWALKWHRRWLELAEEPTWAKFLQLIHKEAK